MEEKGTSNKRLPSHFLDGRPVHKELDKVSGRDQLDGGRGQFSDGEGHHAKSDLEDEMMKRINSLLKEKNHVEVSHVICHVIRHVIRHVICY